MIAFVIFMVFPSDSDMRQRNTIQAPGDEPWWTGF
jgi:hypothetical protein